MTEQGDGGKRDPVEKCNKKTGGRSIKSNLMLSGDVDNDVSTGIFGAVVKKICVFYCKEEEKGQIKQLVCTLGRLYSYIS